MKLRTLRESDTATTSQILEDRVRILWVNDWYDGPLEGMAEVDGNRYFFVLVDQNTLGTEEEQRSFWLVELTADQQKDEEHWHELFCRTVGTHFDFTGRPPLAQDLIDMNAFYEPYQRRTPPDYGNNLVIGWFRM